MVALENYEKISVVIQMRTFQLNKILKCTSLDKFSFFQGHVHDGEL